MDEALKYTKNEQLSKKLNLCYTASLLFSEKNDEKENNNPIFKLLSNLQEIESILNLNENDSIRFLYFNRIKSHSILYDNEEVINIKLINGNDKLDFYIYLCFLIEENLSVVNYIYSINVIKKINDMQTRIKNEKIQKLIMAKIIIVLINNYEQSDNEEDTDSTDLNSLKNFNMEIINDNIKELNQCNVNKNNFLSKKLEEIYSEIIKYLIINNKLDDSEFTNNILKQINLKYIYITKVMFDEIAKLLKSENDYIKDYVIKEYNDLFDLKKINFYYILIRYILKITFYIYEIPFLLETMIKIKTLIKQNISSLGHSIKQNRPYKDKIEFVLKAFIEYKYYYDKSIKAIRANANANTSQQNSNASNQVNISNRSNNNYYGNSININNSESSSGFFSNSSYKRAKEDSGRNFDSFTEEPVNQFEEFEKKYRNEIIFQILQNSSFKYEFKIINKQVTFNCISIIINGQNVQKTYDEIKDITSDNRNLLNNFLKFKEFLEFFENKIQSSYKNKFTFEVTLKFESNSVKLSIFQVDCIYILQINGEEPIEFKDSDIFNNELRENLFLLLNEINEGR